LSRTGARKARADSQGAAIIPPLMEAERLNLLTAQLADLQQRSVELRRYL
jgi:hypothetical protein